jgi:large subunit ribosomal protein L9
VEASTGNLANLKAKQESNQYRKDIQKDEAIKLASKLNDINLQIKVKAGENGKIFGGVTAKEISENLKSQYNIEIDKKKINLVETIKNIGTSTVDIKLYEGVIGKLKVDIRG